MVQNGSDMSTMVPGSRDAGRPPQEVQAGLWLFAPSRDSQGGSAWWLELEGVVLVAAC